MKEGGSNTVHLFSICFAYAIMCLYPRLLQNPKYKPNSKNGGNVPKPSDKRLLSVPVGCGVCEECRKQKATEWKIRFYEEFKGCNEKGIAKYFVTLTFSEDSLRKHRELASIDKGGEEADENDTATKAIRMFLERWRKHHKKSLRHWFITELGHDNTERLHLHGIIMTNENVHAKLEKIWGNGWVHIGDYCNLATIGYITKYITKIDNDHPDFTGKILCSSGIGDFYIQHKTGLRFNKYIGKTTKEYYRSPEGYKLNMPMYYRNHIYTDEEKEKLWLMKMDKKEIYILGTKYDISTQKGIDNYINALRTAQKDNERRGFKKPQWNKKDYKDGLKYINNF